MPSYIISSLLSKLNGFAVSMPSMAPGGQKHTDTHITHVVSGCLRVIAAFLLLHVLFVWLHNSVQFILWFTWIHVERYEFLQWPVFTVEKGTFVQTEPQAVCLDTLQWEKRVAQTSLQASTLSIPPGLRFGFWMMFTLWVLFVWCRFGNKALLLWTGSD